MQIANARQQEIDNNNLEVCGQCEQQFYPLRAALVVDRLPKVSSTISRNGDLLGHALFSDLGFPEIDSKDGGLIIVIYSPELDELR